MFNKKIQLLSPYITVLSLITMLLTLPERVQAVAPCAVCVVAIGGGLGVSRALGIDDAMTGVWVGALLLGLTTFTYGWIKKRWPKFKFNFLVSFGSIYLLTIPFFFIFNLFEAGGYIFGVSKLLIGMISGTIGLVLGLYTDSSLRKLKEDKKAFFPFQKVIIPVIFLLLTTFTMWLIVS